MASSQLILLVFFGFFSLIRQWETSAWCDVMWTGLTWWQRARSRRTNGWLIHFHFDYDPLRTMSIVRPSSIRLLCQQQRLERQKKLHPINSEIRSRFKISSQISREAVDETRKSNQREKKNNVKLELEWKGNRRWLTELDILSVVNGARSFKCPLNITIYANSRIELRL